MATSDRNWQMDTDMFLVDDEEIGQALFEACRILTRMGGAIIIAAQREEVAPDYYETTALAFRWTSYAPAKRLPKEQADETIDEPVEDPVAA